MCFQKASRAFPVSVGARSEDALRLGHPESSMASQLQTSWQILQDNETGHNTQDLEKDFPEMYEKWRFVILT